MLDSPRSVLNLLGGAIAVMLVGFGSGIITARSFAVKGGKDIDADDELLGFGVANLCSGFFGGFPVTASNSRTAVNYAIGGKTQLVGLISAGTLAISVLFIAQVLAYLPSAALGAVLVSAAIDLFDVGELRTLYKLRRSEFVFAMITILGVVIAGPMQGVFIAIAATLGDLLWSTSHPRLAFLGRIPGTTGLLKLHRFPEARPIPGLTIVVLQSPLVFFNADFVKMRLIKLSDASRSPQRWFVLDAAAVNVLDSTGLRKLEEFREYLATQGITFGIADLNSKARTIVDRSGLTEKIGNHMLFPSAEAAAAAFDALYKASTLDMQRPRAEITEA